MPSKDKPCRCRYCGATNERYMARCPACLATGAMTPFDHVSSAVAAEARKAVTTLDEVDAFEGIRIDTGIPGMNRVLGTNRGDGKQGLHVPSTTIFAGGQGCGKTTLALQMLCKIRELSILLLSSEQTLPEIKASLVGIGLGSHAARIPAYSLLDDGYDVACALEKISQVRPRVLVVDSISKMRDAERDTGDRLANRVRLIQTFKRDAEVNNRATILIAHLNKEDQVAGSREEQYDVSAVMMLTKTGKRRRILHCPEKNRFGDTSEQAYFDMGPRGLLELSVEQVVEDRHNTRSRRGRIEEEE